MTVDQAALALVWRIILIVLACVAVYVFQSICMFRIFRKAGTPGWKAFIPLINLVNLWKVMSDTDTFWGLLLTGGFLLLVSIIVSGTFGFWLMLVALYIYHGFDMYNCQQGAIRFGKPLSFSIGLALLPFIFYPILAFDDSVYQVYN